jgi:hypothetical protein
VKYLSGVKKQAQEQSDHKQTMDMVNHPPHYNKAGIETIDAIKAMTNEGFEYYLNKAQWYLSELIDVVKDEHKT